LTQPQSYQKSTVFMT